MAALVLLPCCIMPVTAACKFLTVPFTSPICATGLVAMPEAVHQSLRSAWCPGSFC